MRRVVDVLSLGDLEAAALGVDVRRTRLVLIAAATIGTAAAVAVCGLIAFVGIIVPHAIRLVVGTSYRDPRAALVRRRAGFLISPTSSRERRSPRGGADRRRSRRSSTRRSSASSCARTREMGVGAIDRAGRVARRSTGRARRPPPSSSAGSGSRWSGRAARARRRSSARSQASAPRGVSVAPRRSCGGARPARAGASARGRPAGAGTAVADGRGVRAARANAPPRAVRARGGCRSRGGPRVRSSASTRFARRAAARDALGKAPAGRGRARARAGKHRSFSSTSRRRRSTSATSSRRSTARRAPRDRQADARHRDADLTLAAQYAVEVLLLDEGQVVADGTWSKSSPGGAGALRRLVRVVTVDDDRRAPDQGIGEKSRSSVADAERDRSPFEPPGERPVAELRVHREHRRVRLVVVRDRDRRAALSGDVEAVRLQQACQPRPRNASCP